MNVTNCQSVCLNVCMENLWLSSLGHLININMTARREMGWGMMMEKFNHELNSRLVCLHWIQIKERKNDIYEF